MDVDIVGQPRVLVLVVDALAQRTEVIDTGDALDTGLLIEQVVNLIYAHARLADKVENDAWVNIARTGTHGQTSQRGQAHRGINGAAIADGRSGSAVAQVKGDLVGMHRVATQQAWHLLRDELVGGAVEAVAANIVLGCHLIIDGIQRGCRRQGVEEGGIEDGNVRDIRQHLASHADAVQVSRVVQWSQRDEVLNHGLDLVHDELRLGEEASAVDDTVANGDDIHVGRAHVVLTHDGKSALKAEGVSRDFQLFLVLLATGLHGDSAEGLANLLDQTRNQRGIRGAGFGIDQLEFNGGRT